jgi:hypothetical protein
VHYLLPLFLVVTSLFAGNGYNSSLTKSKHTDQQAIASLSPAPATTNVYPHTDVDIVFTVALDETQIKPHSVRLRQIDGKKIEVPGKTTYISDEKRLNFVPQTLLKPGMYEVDVIAIKPHKHGVNIKNFTYRFSVADVLPSTLKISPDPIELDIADSIDLNASLVYSDGKEVVVIPDSWHSGDSSILTVDNSLAEGLAEGQTTVTASYKSLTSQTTDALIYLEINGHRLPFEPDPAVNNATLLGVDANGNGIRDDVERWILKKYKNKHPIYIDIALQGGRAWQKVLEDPTKAKEIHDYVSAPIYCEGYYSVFASIFGSTNFVEEKIISKVFDLQVFNTQERKKAFRTYQTELSGGAYTLPKPSQGKLHCDFNTSKYEN